MQSEVTVYSSIGGTNMDSGIMPMLEGSSASAEDAINKTISVTWKLPGGIENKKSAGDYRGDEWGYLLNKLTKDEDVVSEVKKEFPDATFDELGNLTSLEYEASIESYINGILYNYVGRALKGQGDLSWDNFIDYFGNDICVHIIF